MNDLIDRQAAIDAVKKAYDKESIESGWLRSFAIRAINGVPSAQQWTPCSKKPPEEGEPVLICFRSAKDTPHWPVQVGYLGFHDMEDNNFQKIGVARVWYTDRFYWDFDKVIAWMPRPEPYKGDQDESEKL